MLTQRKKVFVAALCSALLHVALLFVAGMIVALKPPVAPKTEAKPLHIKIVQSEPLPPENAPPTPQPQVLDTSAMKEAERAPATAKFEGERNTVAASEGPATGDKPLPTQTGRRAPSYVFNPAPPQKEVTSDPAPPLPAEQPATTPPPPEPTKRIARPSLGDPAATLVHNDFAMVDTAPTPPPEEVNPYDPSFRSTAPPPPIPVRAQPRASAYHPLEARTASNGDITNIGAASVDAVATPYGRYRKQVLEAIRMIWTTSVHARSDLAALGTVKVHFAIDRSGHVHAPMILSNSANEALASITLNAITETPIPPIPPDLAETMNGAMLQLDVSFECL